MKGKVKTNLLLGFLIKCKDLPCLGSPVRILSLQINKLFTYKPITVKSKPKHTYNAEYLTGLGYYVETC